MSNEKDGEKNPSGRKPKGSNSKRKANWVKVPGNPFTVGYLR